MIKNTLSKWKDRSHQDITEEEIESLTDEEYQAYLEWRIRVNLNHMEAEGFIVREIKDGTEIFRLKTEEELQAEVDKL